MTHCTNSLNINTVYCIVVALNHADTSNKEMESVHLEMLASIVMVSTDY